MAKVEKITPFLWFDNQAEEAARYYASVFGNSLPGPITRNGDAVLVVRFSLDGQTFDALNGGPQFRFNPSVSFFVMCETGAETDAVWQKLADGGMVMMALQSYPWSEKYGWVQDRFGLSWQVSQGKLSDVGQKFTPTLLFTGSQRGRGEEAVHFYTSLFPDASLDGLSHYKAGGAGPEGSLEHAQFRLFGQTFMAMDNPMAEPQFSFNEAVSFVVHCADQQEVDFFWEKLTADGGEESMCGWLKDKFGVSWQIVPDVLPRLLSDPDPAVARRAMSAMMQMRKIEIDKLTAEPTAPAAPITIETTVNAPVGKVWQRWTEPAHVQAWNNASDDWYTPRAENDLRAGGRFTYTMASRDGANRFDFSGIYDEVVENRRLAYTLDDGRKVSIHFHEQGDQTHIVETFDPENINPTDMQRAGWQAILDNFRKYAEA